METTIQKSYYCFLENFVQKHLDTLLNARVFIFGAGIRGCNLLRLLRIYEIRDIAFVDNNPQKQGTQMDGCSVLSFEDAVSYAGKHVFLCPIENGKPILEQLSRTGRHENIDFFNLDFEFTDYLELVEEIKRPAQIYSLAFGSCELSSNILGSRLISSLGEKLKQQIFPDYCKLCTLPGFSSSMAYHTINASLQSHKNAPRFIFLTMEISSCSPYAPVMLGKQNCLQHKLYVEQLMKLMPADQEICEYYQIVEERLKRSIAGNNPVKSENSMDSRKQVYRLKYNYHIREDDESIVYTKKILTAMNEKKIPVILYFPPVDYIFAETVCGEVFIEKYASIVNSIQSFLSGYSYCCIDASFIAKSDCFVQEEHSPDINPFLNEKGQTCLLEFLRRQEAIQTFLAENIHYEKESLT